MAANAFIVSSGLRGFGATGAPDEPIEGARVLPSMADQWAAYTGADKVGPSLLHVPDVVPASVKLAVGNDPMRVRAYSGAILGVHAAIGYGAYRLFKAKHPVWGTIVGLLALGGVAQVPALVSGKWAGQA
jgi:hypothetical protein